MSARRKRRSRRIPVGERNPTGITARGALRYEPEDVRRIPGVPFALEIRDERDPSILHLVLRDEGGDVFHPGCATWRRRGTCRHAAHACRMADAPLEWAVGEVVGAWYDGGYEPVERAETFEWAVRRLELGQRLEQRRRSWEQHLADQEDQAAREERVSRRLEALPAAERDAYREAELDALFNGGPMPDLPEAERP